ncbi:hypothetical protein PEBR_09747 [Penicillium brasilianum]|uniref:Uncharacterized protein n=1 Tax=Penicillium brasilianum TaxID=104259 RepID=A0A1S9S2A0_PENBI|nr:hypothetical protein PEBR_09747 [Penicillium brasilianum]
MLQHEVHHEEALHSHQKKAQAVRFDFLPLRCCGACSSPVLILIILVPDLLSSFKSFLATLFYQRVSASTRPVPCELTLPRCHVNIPFLVARRYKHTGAYTNVLE